MNFKGLFIAFLSIIITINIAGSYNIATCQSINKGNSKEVEYKNNLMTKLKENKAIIYALIIRTFNANDQNNNDLIDINEKENLGSFVNATERLGKLKALGVNTIHLLPVFPVGKHDALGNAGSLYSPASFLEIDSKLDDSNNPDNVKEEMKSFIDKCHQKDISVMLDVPCCASTDLFKKQPELFLTDSNNNAVIPHNWTDIRLFKVYEDNKNKTLNSSLLKMHKDLVDMCIELGIDGIRADVARTKPPEFWVELITYARTKDPEFGFLAESFCNEKNSTIANIPPDNAGELLESGFDSYYGVYNQFNKWSGASEFHNQIINNLKQLNSNTSPKSLIGSFTTHDEISPMLIGGISYYRLLTILMSTLPSTNPYLVSGFESGDSYLYKYEGDNANYTDTDSNKYFLHHGRIDIFNYSRKPGGNNPEIGVFIKKVFKIRKKYQDIIIMGSYIPLPVKNNPDDQIISYARKFKDKYLIIIANKDLNADQTGNVLYPNGLTKNNTKLILLLKRKQSLCKLSEDYIEVSLPPAYFCLFYGRI
ncbi:MAG: hypothetical protein AB1782_10060 [Cyanobacteriota bacterium]